MKILLLATAIVFSLLGSASAQNLTFATNTYNCPPGSALFSVVAADTRNSGKLDLICANEVLTGSLIVLTNNGNGLFATNAVLRGFGNPIAVVATDVNNDKSLDLVSANEFGNTLTVFTNNGSGVFSSNATLNVGLRPVSVVAANVNNDNQLYLISANSSDNTLTVLTNNGNGVFGSNATLNVGNKPDSVVVATNVDGHGLMALISANFDSGNGNTLTVLTNNGNGVFGSNTTLNVSGAPLFLTAADINGDGKVDLISSANTPNTGVLTILTNDGSGFFSSNSIITVPSNPHCIIAADVNNDGKEDLICVVGGGRVMVFTQTTIMPPKLTIASSSSNSVVVSWSSLESGFVLQTNFDLTNTNWGTFNGTIATNGQFESVIITPPTKNLFFRLISQ